MDKGWLTFNEINVLLQFCERDDMPITFDERCHEVHHQMAAAARSVKAAHEMDPSLQVGTMIAGIVSLVERDSTRFFRTHCGKTLYGLFPFFVFFQFSSMHYKMESGKAIITIIHRKNR